MNNILRKLGIGVADFVNGRRRRKGHSKRGRQDRTILRAEQPLEKPFVSRPFRRQRRCRSADRRLRDRYYIEWLDFSG